MLDAEAASVTVTVQLPLRASERLEDSSVDFDLLRLGVPNFVTRQFYLFSQLNGWNKMYTGRH
jgi:hypothetical protein